MPKQIELAELIEIARKLDPEGGPLRSIADATVRGVEALMQALGEAVAERLGVECTQAEYDSPDFGGICLPFYARQVGQPCPPELMDYDSPEWSAIDGTDLDHKTGKEI